MTKTLVLNATYEPLAVVSFRRAVVLVLNEKAHVVASSGAELRSASGAAFDLPSVIRLVRYVKVPYRATPPVSKENVLLRDEHTCQYCGCARAQTIDHVLPRSRGGRDEWTNLVAACGPCNQRKDDRTPAEAAMRLLREPVAPYGRAWIVLGIARREPAWNSWLVPHRARA